MSDSGLSGGGGAPATALSRAAEPGAVLEGRSAFMRARRDEIVVVSGRGLRLPPKLAYARWLQVGRQLAEIYTSSAWCLGDWLVYGEAAYAERYREAVGRTCLDYQTLRNYAWVARRFSLSRRRDRLSFGHHAEVAVLAQAEQDFWLRKAQDLGWSVKKLRYQVRVSLSERTAAEDGTPGAEGGIPGPCRGDRPDCAPCSRVWLNIRITPDQLESCQAAASEAGLTIEQWVVLTLDQAARHLLGTGLPTATTHRTKPK